MPALRDIQSALLEDIYNGTQKKALPFIDAAHADRLSIYANNMRFGLTDALSDAYPVIQSICGDDFFRTLARDYIQSHPQATGNRNDFGAALAPFLESYTPAQALAYLPDLARLEWACFTANFADDAKTTDLETLSKALNAGEEIFLGLHPAVTFFAAAYNVLDIWQAHQQTPVDSVTLTKKEQALLIWRAPDDQICLSAISPAMAGFMTDCQNGAEFTQSLSNTVNSSAFQAEFAQHTTQGVFTITSKDKTHV